jgi:tRNA threonylcarbamoyladenosine biosynthesis protein TsaE
MSEVEGGRTRTGIVRLGEGRWRIGSVEAMWRLGEALGSVLEDGDVLVLTGDLGAGKTQLAKGIARAMGVRDEVTSPTFTIEMAYQGTELPLYHFDLYRLESADELEDTGIFDVLGEGVCLVEWGERFARQLGEERLDVYVERLDDAAEAGTEPPRRVRLVAHDARSEAIVRALDERLGAHPGPTQER